MNVKGIQKFLVWLKAANPALWALTMVQIPETKALMPDNKTMSGYLGEIDWGAIGSNIADLLGKALPIYQQQQVFKTQLKLAEQGKPMLDPQQVQVPGIPIKVDIPPEMQSEVRQTLATTRSSMNWGLLAVGGLALFFMMKKR